MSPLQHALLFGGICLVAAVVICWSCCVSAKRQGVFDADLDQHRTPRMGDISCRFCDDAEQDARWDKHVTDALLLANSATPIYEQLAAETLAEEIGTDAFYDWLERTP